MNLHPYKKPDKAELRKFALVTGGMLVGLFGLLFPLWRHQAMPTWPRWPFYVAAPLGLIGLIAPSLLGPVHRGWMAVGSVLGYINTRIILSVVFFALLTPIGLLMRLLGKDALGRRLQRGQLGSYRIESHALAPERFKEPF